MNELTRQRIHAMVEAHLLPPPKLPVRMPLPSARWRWAWVVRPVTRWQPRLA